jgi:diketogulonate reductase-like aldo/keto reductase
MQALMLALTPLASVPKFKEIAPGVVMPTMSLGTCCGSDPSVGVAPWLAAGGVGIDTANDYRDQPAIAAALNATGTARNKIFLTTKVPAGTGVISSTARLDCSLDPHRSLSVLQDNLEQLQMSHVDLVLLHGPCELQGATAVVDPAKANAAQWQGLQMALAQGLTRSIGVSNYNISHLAALLAAPTTTVKPAVNQCQMSINGSAFCLPQTGMCLHGPAHDDATIAYCQEHNITYEAYDVMSGCPFHDARLNAIATGHGMSAAQVCFRWTLQRGAIIATGTGHNATKAVQHSADDFGSYAPGFELTEEEMAYLNGIHPARSV